MTVIISQDSLFVIIVCYDDQIMDDETEETCSDHGKVQKCIHCFHHKLKGRDHFEEQKCRLQDNIKINLKGTRKEDIERTEFP